VAGAMMFRQAAPLTHHVSHGRVTWGPFPARWPLVGMTLALLIVGVAMLAVGLTDQRFACAGKQEAMCTIDGRTAFPRDAIRRLDVIIEKGSKNATYGVVTFTFDNGTTHKLMRVDPDDAHVAAQTIESALSNGGAIDVDLHGPRLVALFGFALLVASAVFAVKALAQMGHFDLVVTPDGQTLRVTRTLFLLPLGTRDIPLSRVTAVVLDRKMVSPPLAGRYEPNVPVARLMLHYRGVEETPITRGYFPGHAVHLRAGHALRRMLDLDPSPADDAELASLPMRTTQTTMRVMYAWMGVTSGAMVGLLLFGISMILLGRITARQNLEGWVMLFGAGLGAVGGVGFVVHATRARLPR
jgi:hypothetical protein